MARQVAKAARVLGYSNADWYTLNSAERRRARQEVYNADRRVHNFAKRSAEDRKRSNQSVTEDWDTVDWDLYREEMGL